MTREAPPVNTTPASTKTTEISFLGAKRDIFLFCDYPEKLDTAFSLEAI
jgi:hypothetical protein